MLGVSNSKSLQHEDEDNTPDSKAWIRAEAPGQTPKAAGDGGQLRHRWWDPAVVMDDVKERREVERPGSIFDLRPHLECAYFHREAKQTENGPMR